MHSPPQADDGRRRRTNPGLTEHIISVPEGGEQPFVKENNPQKSFFQLRHSLLLSILNSYPKVPESTKKTIKKEQKLMTPITNHPNISYTFILLCLSLFYLPQKPAKMPKTPPKKAFFNYLPVSYPATYLVTISHTKRYKK